MVSSIQTAHEPVRHVTSEPLTLRSGSRLPMASFHDAIEMASSDDEDIAGSGGGDDHHRDFDDDELPFLEPAAREDMIEGSDGEAEGVALPGLASEESEDEDEHARPPPPPVLPARQGVSRTLLDTRNRQAALQQSRCQSPRRSARLPACVGFRLCVLALRLKRRVVAVTIRADNLRCERPDLAAVVTDSAASRRRRSAGGAGGRARPAGAVSAAAAWRRQ